MNVKMEIIIRLGQKVVMITYMHGADFSIGVKWKKVHRKDILIRKQTKQIKRVRRENSI